MRKKISALLITAFLTASPFSTALAAEAQNVSSVAGITPDSIFYTVERTVEKIQLVITSDPVKIAKLLTGNAEERLAEAQVMNEEDKTQLAEQAANEYTATVQQAAEVIQAAVEQANAEDNASTTQTTTTTTTGTTTNTTTPTSGETTTGTTTSTTTSTTGDVNQDGMNSVLAELLKKNLELQKRSVDVLASLLDKLPENAQKAITAVIVKQILHTEAVKNYVDAKKTYKKDRSEANYDAFQTAITAKRNIKTLIEEKLAEIDALNVDKDSENTQTTTATTSTTDTVAVTADASAKAESIKKSIEKIEKEVKEELKEKNEAQGKAQDKGKVNGPQVEKQVKEEVQKKVEEKKEEAKQKAEEKKVEKKK